METSDHAVTSTTDDAPRCDGADVEVDETVVEDLHVKTTIRRYTCCECHKVLKEVITVRRDFTCRQCFPSSD